MRNTPRPFVSLLLAALPSLSLMPACATEPGDTASEPSLTESPAKTPDTIDPLRSLAVTEQPILARFSLQRVLDRLAQQSGVPGATALTLFRQLWGTMNPASPGSSGPHCNDQLFAGTTRGAINGFPFDCREVFEGTEATSNPFDPADGPQAYIPVGLFNRFDLAPADGTTCGEHRIVYARKSGQTDSTKRNLIIFEAALLNRKSEQGIKGCKKIGEFWTDLSGVDDITTRANKLEDFYFNGVAPFDPVISIDNYGGSGWGQVRTNSLLMSSATLEKHWTMRELHIVHNSTSVFFQPVTVKTNPFGDLFNVNSSHPKAAAFRQYFPSVVASLAVNNLDDINADIPDNFNAGQSDSSRSPEDVYTDQFGTADSAFRTAITNALPAGSTLTADNIVARAQALSCAGCHRLNAQATTQAKIGGGLLWPLSTGFTHVTEVGPVTGPDGVTRFQLSPALTQSFLPHRKQILEDFVFKDKVPKTKKSTDAIGGRKVH